MTYFVPLSGKSLPVYLRIPGWAAAATVDGAAAKNGTLWRGVASGSTTFTVAFHPAVRLETWDYGGAVSVHRGALMYSLPVAPNYTVYGAPC